MQRLTSTRTTGQTLHLGSLLDHLIHPKRDPDPAADPGWPFTPPPSEPSKQEKEDDDDGPGFPMDPALA